MLALTAALSRGSALKSDEFKSAIYVCQTWQLMSVKFRGEKSSSSKRYEVYSSKLYTTTMIFFLDIITNNISYNHWQIVLMMCRKTKYTIYPRAVVVCQSLVVNDKRREETEEEGAQQFTTHDLRQIFKAL